MLRLPRALELERTPEPRGAAELISDSPPPAPPSGYGKGGGRSVATPSPYGDRLPAIPPTVRGAERVHPDYHGGADQSGGSR